MIGQSRNDDDERKRGASDQRARRDALEGTRKRMILFWAACDYQSGLLTCHEQAANVIMNDLRLIGLWHRTCLA